MHKRYRRLAARLLSIVMAAGMSVSGVSVSVLAAEASDESAQQETVAATEPEDEVADAAEPEPEDEVADAAEPEPEDEVADAAEPEPEIEEDTVTLEVESVPAAEVQNDSAAAGETSEINETPENGWYQINGLFKYYIDGEPVQGKVIEIGGVLYGFDYCGYLQSGCAFELIKENTMNDLLYYRAHISGQLYVNEWYEEEDLFGDSSYYYYGEGGVAASGMLEVAMPEETDAHLRCFEHDGRMKTNSVYTDNNGIQYLIDSLGIMTVDFYPTEDGYWDENGERYYLDGEPVCDAVIDIDGKFYGFDSDGRLYRNRAFYLLILPTYVFYRATEDGSLIVNDWYEDENGNKYYYGEGGAAPSSGLNSVDGITYYFFNYGQILLNNYYIENETGDMYHADETGAAEKVEAEDGWVDFEDGQRAYFRYGKPVAHEVITDGGRYYGFGVNGIMHRNATFVITTDYYSGPSYYRAHEDGHLYVNEWAQDGDDWYYYFDAGKAKAGLFNLGGKLYVFTAKGLMRKNENYTDYATGNQYVIGSDGVARLSSAVSDGWVQSGNLYYFVENGRYIKGQVKKIGGTYYGFDYSGIMYDDVPFENYSNGEGSNYRAKKGGALYANSWYEGNDGSWYYYGADAKMAKGWNQIGGKWYYFDSEGRMAAGQQEIDGTSYFFKDSGVMATGWQEIEGSWYYFGSSGAMVKENWQQSGNAWYYFEEDGEMVTGLQEISGASYFFKDSGAMVTGWQEIDGSWYYFGSSGAMVKKNWQQSGNAWYYFDEDGEMVTGLQEIGGRIYFFKDSGAMVTGWQEIDGYWYYFAGSGAMVKDNWQQSGNTWYYFDGEGKMLTGLQEIGGRIYFFKDSGAMVTGWQQVGDDWYYFESGGAAACSKWAGNYYMLDSGVMATNQWVDNGRYYVGADGLWIPNYKEAI